MVESVVFVSLMAFFSGLVGGIVSDVYITPEYDEYSGIIRESRVVTRTIQQTPDPLFLREQYRRMLYLVPKPTYQKLQHIVPGTAVQAVLLTDTGWFVVPSLGNNIQAKSWVAVTSEGEVYDIESIVPDETEELVYGSLDGDGFRVVTFPFLDALDPGTGLWIAYNGTLEKNTLAYPEKNNTMASVYSPNDASYTFKPYDASPAGSVVWGEDGSFVGFVDKEGAIKPWFVVKSVYTKVFTGNPIEHQTLPFRGYSVILTEDQHALAHSRYGFYIADVSVGVEDVQSGDIVVALSGNPIVPWTLNAMLAEHVGEHIEVNVLRDGDIQSTQIQKEN